jgi:hypothetical protein
MRSSCTGELVQAKQAISPFFERKETQMQIKHFKTAVPAVVVIFFISTLVFLPYQTSAHSLSGDTSASATLLDEVPSPHYDSILYSEIGPRLAEIAQTSQRVKVDVIGQSAGGLDIYLVTITDPQSMGRLGRYKALRNMMLKDPDRALQMIDQFNDFKVPIFINGSIHGNEYPGTDAAMRLIETLAFDSSPQTLEILSNVILLINVVQNPDGRVLGTRENANGFDINRDFITQSQPETRATVKVITEWNPMVLLDLHGFVNPMLIEPCTPLHNPNYEYDLYIRWAYFEAEAMEAELLAQTGFKAQIPFRDMEIGWDDYPPTYTPMYAMYHGAYGHTLETPYRDERGVDAHYWAVWGALKFASQNRTEMIRDQIEIFRRGFLGLPQLLIPDELLTQTQFDQYNQLTIQEFPAAYVIPAGEPGQPSDHQAKRLVNFLLFNDVQVDKTLQEFSMDSQTFPAGTFIIWMVQPKRGMANTILESGRDLSELEEITFYSPPSAWSNPLLWGAERYVMEEKIEVSTRALDRPLLPQGGVTSGPANGYAFLPTSIAAYLAANQLTKEGYTIYRMPEAFQDEDHIFESGVFIIPEESALVSLLVNQYALDLYALQSIPVQAVQLHQPNIAVSGDADLLYALRQLGLEPVLLSSRDLNTGRIQDFDIFINQSTSWNTLSNPGKAAFTEFFNRGGDYLGLPGNGITFAVNAGILDASPATARGNAIVQLELTDNDSVIAGFGPTTYAFVSSPTWFEGVGAEVTVNAALPPNNFLISGYWPGWQESTASGKPVIITQSTGLSDVTAAGIDMVFRGHPENAFRILGSVIFAAQD